MKGIYLCFYLFCFLCSIGISINSSGLNGYHQEYFVPNDKRLDDIWSVLSKFFPTTSSDYSNQNNWRLHKLVLYIKEEKDIGINYKIFFASINREKTKEDIHQAIVFYSFFDKKSQVISYDRMHPEKRMVINNKKYSVINELIVKWLKRNHQKMQFLIEAIPYSNIVYNHNLYLVHARISETFGSHSFIVFEEDNKMNVLASL